MPIKHDIWKVGATPVPLASGRLPSEQKLEEMIVSDPRILSTEWLVIGRQEYTNHGGRIDLLAIAPDGSLVLIELKRDRTPREIVAQALDYASWVEELTPEKIAQIYQRYSDGGKLDDAFQKRFGVELDEETLNQSHQVIIVASELDPSTERIINYLNARDIAIKAVFFQVFQNGDDQLLSRAWLIDPGETQANVAAASRTKGEKEPWNGEYYVYYGADRSRDEARQYGFVSGGGGSCYSRTGFARRCPFANERTMARKAKTIDVCNIARRSAPLDGSGLMSCWATALSFPGQAWAPFAFRSRRARRCKASVLSAPTSPRRPRDHVPIVC